MVFPLSFSTSRYLSCMDLLIVSTYIYLIRVSTRAPRNALCLHVTYVYLTSKKVIYFLSCNVIDLFPLYQIRIKMYILCIVYVFTDAYQNAVHRMLVELV